MIDLHTHILPGLDDGARTLEDSISMAAAAVVRGVTALAATPHVRDDYPTSAETMLQRLHELRGVLTRGAVQLELLPGAEVSLAMVERLDEEQLRSFGLGGNPSYLLIECPYYGWQASIERTVFELRRRGITSVIAHPERNPDVQERPSLLRNLVELGALVQLTAASLTGVFGRHSRATAQTLLRSGNAHLVASDDHGGKGRQVETEAIERALADAALMSWLTVDVPGAIVSDTPIPSRPGRRSPRWSLRR